MHTLSCYHRNLTMAAMQAEAMLAMIKAVQSKVESGTPLQEFMKQVARNAAVGLGLLFLGQSDTYRSCSISAQIADSGLFDQLNKTRAYFTGLSQLDPLAVKCTA